jgi:outer membrane murein-binding lipoprotein Lpp
MKKVIKMKILTISAILAVAILSGCASNTKQQIAELEAREKQYQTELARMQKEQEKRELYFRLDKVEAVAQQKAPRNQECKIFCF